MLSTITHPRESTNHTGHSHTSHTTGGITSWSSHELLSQTTLEVVSQQIKPLSASCFSPISLWAKDDLMKRQHQNLIHLIDAKFPQTDVVTETERRACIDSILEQSIQLFSQPSGPNPSLQNYLKQLIIDLLPNRDPELNPIQQQLFALTAWLLFLQNLGDNPKYTPHGYEHSLDVARWMAKITQLEKGPFQQFRHEYGLTAHQGRALMAFSGLVHDCGYPYLNLSKKAQAVQSSYHSTKQATKATHAVIGGFMFHKIIQPKLMQLLKTTAVKKPDHLCRVMGRAIHLHSSDSPDHKLAAGIQVSTEGGALLQLRSPEQLDWLQQQMPLLGDNIKRIKTDIREPLALQELKRHFPKTMKLHQSKRPLPQARFIDAHTPKDVLLGTPCIDIKERKHPVAYWLMLADNLDINHKRLGEIQGNPLYGKILFHKYKNNNPSNEGLTELAQTAMANTSNETHPITPLECNNILLTAAAASPEDLPYLIGSLSIEDVQLKKPGPATSTGSPLKILVQMRSLPQWLIQSTATYQRLLKYQLFNVKRLKEALENLDPKPEVEVIGTNTQPQVDVTETTPSKPNQWQDSSNENEHSVQRCA